MKRHMWVVLTREAVPTVYGPFQTQRDAMIWGNRWVGERSFAVIKLRQPWEGEIG